MAWQTSAMSTEIIFATVDLSKSRPFPAERKWRQVTFPRPQRYCVCRKACRECVANILANLSQRSMPPCQAVEQLVGFTFGDDQTSIHQPLVYLRNSSSVIGPLSTRVFRLSLLTHASTTAERGKYISARRYHPFGDHSKTSSIIRRRQAIARLRLSACLPATSRRHEFWTYSINLEA